MALFALYKQHLHVRLYWLLNTNWQSNKLMCIKLYKRSCTCIVQQHRCLYIYVSQRQRSVWVQQFRLDWHFPHLSVGFVCCQSTANSTYYIAISAQRLWWHHVISIIAPSSLHLTAALISQSDWKGLQHVFNLISNESATCSGVKKYG